MIAGECKFAGFWVLFFGSVVLVGQFLAFHNRWLEERGGVDFRMDGWVRDEIYKH